MLSTSDNFRNVGAKNTKGVAVSLIICTRNRAPQLETCLEYVLAQSLTSFWEVVVVDNGSSDGTGAILEKFLKIAPFPVATCFERQPGLGRARNVGWRLARGDIIAFTDDDCYLPPDYLDRLCEAFDDPRIGFAGGRVTLFDINDYPISIKTVNERELLQPRSYVEPGWVLGASMAFRRQVLEAICGFDDAFGTGTRFCCEDADAQARASFMGWSGVCTPKVAVAHHHRRKSRDVPALRRQYSFGTGAYKMKFVLLPETRSIYLKNWYWTFWRVLIGHYALRDLSYELQGAINYLLRRLLTHCVWLSKIPGSLWWRHRAAAGSRSPPSC